jgi:hypothetical protein
MQTGDGSIQEYRLCRTREGLRFVRPFASYDLASMMREEGWRIIGVRTGLAKRLLTTAGRLPAAVPLLPRSGPATRHSQDLRFLGSPQSRTWEVDGIDSRCRLDCEDRLRDTSRGWCLVGQTATVRCRCFLGAWFRCLAWPSETSEWRQFRGARFSHPRYRPRLRRVQARYSVALIPSPHGSPAPRASRSFSRPPLF